MPEINLTASQEVAASGIVAAYSRGDRVVGIQGMAGAGKTYMLKEAIDRLGLMDSTVFTAPTHEACKQLKLDLPEDAKVMTIYKLAGMRVTEDHEEQFTVPASELELDDYAVVVIDEVSMAGEGLYARFQEMRALYPNVLFILVGDRYQLKPPKSPISPFFDEYRKPNSFELMESMRMHPDSPVLATAMAIRSLIDEGYKGNVDFQPEKSEHGNIYVAPIKKFNESFCRAVQSEGYTPKRIVAIAYTNKRVEQLNRLARNAIHGKDAPDWLVGEEVTLLQPLQEEGFTLVNTNSTGVIMAVDCSVYSQQAMDMLPEFPVRCDDLSVNFDGIIQHCLVPDAMEGEKSFRDGLAYLKRRALQSQSKYDWRKFHQFRLSVAHMRHTYAITAHKSQGKSYDDVVYVDAVNMQHSKHRPSDLINLLNVAITRSRNDVVIAQR